MQIMEEHQEAKEQLDKVEVYKMVKVKPEQQEKEIQVLLMHKLVEEQKIVSLYFK